jgi:hypothetical protein
MPNEKGWPDAANPGFPWNPNQEGPHLITDQHGQRRWYFWVAAGGWFSGSFQCSPAFAGEHWRYIGAAIAPDDERAESGFVEFPEEDVWTKYNHNYREDLEAAMRNLVDEIARSLGIKGELYPIDQYQDFDGIVRHVTDAFSWLASTAVLRKMIANEFDMRDVPRRIFRNVGATN